jgi:hypothetical protein
MLTWIPLTVVPGQPVSIIEEIIEASALTQEDVIVHVPTMSPPQGAVLPHVPPEPPQPERIITARKVEPRTDRVFFMRKSIAGVERDDNPYSLR